MNFSVVLGLTILNSGPEVLRKDMSYLRQQNKSTMYQNYSIQNC